MYRTFFELSIFFWTLYIPSNFLYFFKLSIFSWTFYIYLWTFLIVDYNLFISHPDKQWQSTLISSLPGQIGDNSQENQTLHLSSTRIMLAGAGWIISGLACTCGTVCAHQPHSKKSPKSLFCSQSQLVHIWPSYIRLLHFRHQKSLCKYFCGYPPSPVRHSGQSPHPTFHAPAL